MRSWQRFPSPRCQNVVQPVLMTNYLKLLWKTARRTAIADELGGNTKSPRAPAPVHRRQLDDGKSTFVGRLLHDTKSVLADQLESMEKSSKDRGFDGLDLSLLVDG